MKTSKRSLRLIGMVIGLLLIWTASAGTTHAAPYHTGISNVGIAAPPAMNEPDTTLTDYGLTIECTLFALLLFQRRNGRLGLPAWFALFFLSTGLASFVGGTTHGFFPDGSGGERILWPVTLLTLGVTALALWVIGAKLLASTSATRWLSTLAVIAFCCYSAVVLFVNQLFLIAIIDYLPATVFLLALLSLRYARRREQAVLVGVLGLLLTFVAAYVQQAKIGLNPQYFNYNALYHLIQAVALGMFFLSARQLTKATPATGLSQGQVMM